MSDRYRQDADLAYLSGWLEPESVLLLVRPFHDITEPQFHLFVRERNELKELWDGPRSGLSAATSFFGADHAHNVANLETEFSEIIHRYHLRKVHIPSSTKHCAHRDLRLLERVTSSIADNVRARDTDTDRDTKTETAPVEPILHSLRAAKSPAEQFLLRQAGKATAMGHNAVMRAVRPGISEATMASVMGHAFVAEAGALGCAFPTIAASGSNANTLHYVANDAIAFDGELVLMDAGALEIGGYSGDCTRTFPVNGKYSNAQRTIYEVVLDCQKKCIEAVVPGTTLAELNDLCSSLLIDGLRTVLGVQDLHVDEKSKRTKYNPHGVGHHLGLDVHDIPVIASSVPLPPGAVITIEPGLYLPENDLAIPEKYRGIGIRIEDTVVVRDTKSLPAEVLTSDTPKEVTEVEMMINSTKGL